MSDELRPVTPWEIERWRLRELPPERLADLDARAARDPKLAAARETLDRSDAEILADWPPRVVAVEVQRRADAARRPRTRWALVPALAAAAAALIWVGAPPEDTPPSPVFEDRVKGVSARLRVYRADATGPRELSDGARVAPGDLLQVTWARGAEAEGVIASIDGAGNVTLHAEQLPPGRQSGALPSAFELDATPGFERFFLVTGPRVEAGTVLDAAARLAAGPAPATAPLALPPDLTVQSLLLRKELP